MSDTRPGADELRVRNILKRRGVGPDAAPPPLPRQLLPGFPAARERDWLDDILDSNATPAAAPPPLRLAPPAQAPAEPVKETAAQPASPKRKKARAQAKTAAPFGFERSPRQSLLDAYNAIPPRVKWLAYHATAAYLGWTIGLVDWTTRVTAWIATTGLIGPQAVFWYAAAGGTFLLHHRTRHWWRPVAWLATVPASSVVAGVLLYAPIT